MHPHPDSFLTSETFSLTPFHLFPEGLAHLESLYECLRSLPARVEFLRLTSLGSLTYLNFVYVAAYASSIGRNEF